MTEPTKFSEELDPVFRRIEAQLQGHLELPPDELVAHERARAETEWRVHAEASGIPRRLWCASLRDGEPTFAVERAREYLVAGELEAGGCLVLAGPTGAGKSYAAVGAIRHAGFGRFRYWPAACGALLNPETRNEELQMLKASPSLLVLDDVGTEYLKADGLVEAFFDELIWQREGNALPTIMTTNLTTEGLKARWSARIVDRIRGGWGSVAECPGESMRGGA